MKWLVAVILALAAPALAHDGVVHKTAGEGEAHALGPVTALPFDLGGAYTLMDQNGASRTEISPDGRAQLVFFGYANCPAICSVAMPLMAEITDALNDMGHAIEPVLITVDPERDTVENMGPALARLHPDFIGLTGTPEQLAHVYQLYKVSHEKMFDDPEHGAVFAHGSHIYLLDKGGKVLTLIPPILGLPRAQRIVAKYLGS